jgi:mRNA-degrading endonuclease toxin of MazEF toxin-antitoxin module
MNPPEPLRGEVWDLDLDPITGSEQAGFRPALVMSVDLFNVGPAELVVAVPIIHRITSHALWGPEFRFLENSCDNGRHHA